MDHKPIFELEILLDDAKKAVEIGAKYYHYKDTTKFYTVTGLSIWEPTDEVIVKYAMDAHPEIEFVRPLTAWLETLTWDSRQVCRFTKV
jgi:hypothetical protein